MSLTRNMTAEIESEVELAIENHAAKITEDNFAEIIAFKTLGKDAEWSVKTCAKCKKTDITTSKPLEQNM